MTIASLYLSHWIREWCPSQLNSMRKNVHAKFCFISRISFTFRAPFIGISFVFRYQLLSHHFCIWTIPFFFHRSSFKMNTRLLCRYLKYNICVYVYIFSTLFPRTIQIRNEDYMQAFAHTHSTHIYYVVW